MNKILVVDDDFVNRLVLQKMCEEFGEVHVAVNGKEALVAIRLAFDEGKPYDVICLDLMMPEMDGHDALCAIRGMEEELHITEEQRPKILMTTALDDSSNVMKAFRGQCDGYLVKPIDSSKLADYISEFGSKGG
ncbi:MAG: response regulator [Spartobacteria bacterium]|nr:response regulator [Spartobacteria bacterium]